MVLKLTNLCKLMVAPLYLERCGLRLTTTYVTPAPLSPQHPQCQQFQPDTTTAYTSTIQRRLSPAPVLPLRHSKSRHALAACFS